jgi:hypothetical protein
MCGPAADSTAVPRWSILAPKTRREGDDDSDADADDDRDERGPMQTLSRILRELRREASPRGCRNEPRIKDGYEAVSGDYYCAWAAVGLPTIAGAARWASSCPAACGCSTAGDPTCGSY